MRDASDFRAATLHVKPLPALTRKTTAIAAFRGV